MSRIHVLLVVLLVTVGCGVGTYRAGQVSGELQVRLVAEDSGEPVRRWFSDEVMGLEDAVLLDATHVREVHLEERPDGVRHIVLHLTDEGAEALSDATTAHQGRRLAIVVEGRIVAAPTIREPITTGEAHVTVDGDIDRVFEAIVGERPSAAGESGGPLRSE